MLIFLTNSHHVSCKLRWITRAFYIIYLIFCTKIRSLLTGIIQFRSCVCSYNRNVSSRWSLACTFDNALDAQFIRTLVKQNKPSLITSVIRISTCSHCSNAFVTLDRFIVSSYRFLSPFGITRTLYFILFVIF